MSSFLDCLPKMLRVSSKGKFNFFFEKKVKSSFQDVAMKVSPQLFFSRIPIKILQNTYASENTF